MKQSLLRKSLPLLVIVAVWFIFSSPFFLKARIPFPGDYLVNHFSPWTSEEGFTHIVKNGAMPDILDQIVPWKMYTIDSLKHGFVPLWNPYSFSGTEHLANFQSAVLSPLNVLFFIFSFPIAWGLLILLQPLIAGISMYVFLRVLNKSTWASVLGSISFMFCGFITVWMEYGTLAYAALWLPLALLAIEKFQVTERFRYLILLAITFPLSFFSGHVQTSIYFSVLVFCYLLCFTTGKKRLLGSLAALSGFLLTMPQLLPSLSYFMQSTRYGAVSNGEIVPWQYVLTLFAPDFYGNPVTGNTWFGHYAEWNGYTGVVAFFLSFFAFFKRDSRVIFFGLSGLFALLLAYDTVFIRSLVAWQVPFFANAAASRILILWSFSLSVLAAFGLDQLREGNISKKMLAVFASVPTVFAIGVWANLIVGMKVWHVASFAVAKQNMILPTVFLLLVLGITITMTILKKKLVMIGCLVLLIAIVSFDMLRFSSKWNAFTPVSLMYPQSSVTNDFAPYATYERVFGLFTAEVGDVYHLPLLDGYDPFYITRYGQFIAFTDNGTSTRAGGSIVNVPRSGLYTKQALDLLNTRYIFHKISDGQADWEFHFWNYPGLEKTGENSVYQVFTNHDSLPHVWIPQSYVVDRNSDTILPTLFGANFDRSHTIILEQDPNIHQLGSGSATITSYKPEQILVKTSVDHPSLLFLSEIYDPGWEALVDDRAAKIYRADYTFRAIVVPAGTHTVEFVYNPWQWKLGLILMGTGMLLLLSIYFTQISQRLSTKFLP